MKPISNIVVMFSQNRRTRTINKKIISNYMSQSILFDNLAQMLTFLSVLLHLLMLDGNFCSHGMVRFSRNFAALFKPRVQIASEFWCPSEKRSLFCFIGGTLTQLHWLGKFLSHDLGCCERLLHKHFDEVNNERLVATNPVWPRVMTF